MGTIMGFVSRLRAFDAGITALKSDHAMLAAIGEDIKREAQSAMGTYRYGWPRLKDEMIARRATGDSPLVENGRMRSSIKVRVMKSEADVYSTDKNFPYHEHGTPRIPPKPVFAIAAKAVALSPAQYSDACLLASCSAGLVAQVRRQPVGECARHGPEAGATKQIDVGAVLACCRYDGCSKRLAGLLVHALINAIGNLSPRGLESRSRGTYDVGSERGTLDDPACPHGHPLPPRRGRPRYYRAK